MTPEGRRLEALVKDEVTATVVAVDGADELDAASAGAARVEEAAVSRHTQPVEAAMSVDSNHPCYPVRSNTVQEPSADYGVDESQVRHEFA